MKYNLDHLYYNDVVISNVVGSYVNKHMPMVAPLFMRDITCAIVSELQNKGYTEIDDVTYCAIVELVLIDVVDNEQLRMDLMNKVRESSKEHTKNM
jgi:hypothetical protein